MKPLRDFISHKLVNENDPKEDIIYLVSSLHIEAVHGIHKLWMLKATDPFIFIEEEKAKTTQELLFSAYGPLLKSVSRIRLYLDEIGITPHPQFNDPASRIKEQLDIIEKIAKGEDPND